LDVIAAASVYLSGMPSTHGWSLVDEQRKREIIAAIAGGHATRGPVHVELDLTDRCNVACYFCNQQDVRTTEQLPLPQVLGLLDELVAGGLRSVRLSGGGDPLAHRDIRRVMARLTEIGVVIDNLTTNGALLGPEIAELLIGNGCREVIVSLNAADAADYQRMMRVRPATFDRVLGNVRHLVARRGDRPLPPVTVQFLIDRVNYPRLPEMVRLGRQLGANRVTVTPVLDVPLARIDRSLLLLPQEATLVAPFLAEALLEDRDFQRLETFFPYGEWMAMLAAVRGELGLGDVRSPFTTAPSLTAKDEHCFFGWYTAAIRGNGDLYPCCMLMNSSYQPLGNARSGTFQEHWQGEAFGRLRHEMRELFLRSGRIDYSPGRFRALGRPCVEKHRCFLKNMYFRHDEEFYRELAAALDAARRREVRWLGTPRQIWRAIEVTAHRCHHAGRALRDRLRHRLAARRRRGADAARAGS
jgi:MoaA/NifB/PqqE/SkfB family radical SAM enzyme